MEVTINYTMSEDTFLDIVDAAGYAIAYWAQSARLYDGTYTITTNDGGRRERHQLKREDYAKAALTAFATPGIRASLKDACALLVHSDDASEIDGDHADMLTQLACYGEIIYG